MSLKKLVVLSAIGVAVGGFGIHLYESSAPRSPASFPAPKLKLWSKSPAGKMNQSISVQISAVGGVPDRDDQDLRLKAEVTLNRPVDQEVKFMWVLPPEASVVSGELEDAWPNLQAGQTATTEIVLQGVSKESMVKTVTLHVSALSQGVRYASAGSFATNSIEALEANESIGVMKVQNSQLGLKNSESAGKLLKLHQ